MKRGLLLALGVWMSALACTPKENRLTSDALPSVSLLPGRMLGPVRLGMTRSELDKIGLKVKEDPTNDHVVWVGELRVVLGTEIAWGMEPRATQVSLDLAHGRTVAIEGTRVSAGMAANVLAASLVGCDRATLQEVAEGGHLVPCHGVDFADDAHGVVDVRVTRTCTEEAATQYMGLTRASFELDEAPAYALSLHACGTPLIPPPHALAESLWFAGRSVFGMASAMPVGHRTDIDAAFPRLPEGDRLCVGVLDSDQAQCFDVGPNDVTEIAR